MLDSVRGKIAAAVAMAACCGLSMAVVLGVIAFTSLWALSGLAIAVGVACVALMAVMRRHGHHGARHDDQTSGSRPRELTDKVHPG